MKHTLRAWISMALIIVSTLACAVPALSTPVPFNTLDPNSLSTAIAGTSAALAIQTGQAVPPVTQPSPIPTETTQPTETATATPQVSAEGTSLAKQSDGSLIFSDYQGGYAVIVPAGWLAMRLNDKEYINAWSLPEASEPNIQRLLTQLQQSDPKVYRLFGIDTQPDHRQSDFATNFSILWDRNDTHSIEEEISLTRKSLPENLFGSKVTSSGMRTTSGGIPMGMLEASTTVKLTSGQNLTLYQKQVIFKGKTGLLAFTFTTITDLKDILLPGFNSMTEGIKMLPRE